jgi:hypothetical protein
MMRRRVHHAARRRGGVADSGASAAGWGTGGPEFESRRSDQQFQILTWKIGNSGLASEIGGVTPKVRAAKN